MNSDDWCTPRWIAGLLGHWSLDPCSNKRSHVDAELTYSPDNDVQWRDGLAGDWFGSVFVNPPYSKPLPWCQKLAAHGGPWCALIKLDPSTRWYAALMHANPIVAPFRKRIRFEGDKSMTANFPSALVYSAWRPSAELAAHLWIARYA